MRIEHVALWTANIERLKGFYETYFQAKAGDKYVNAKKQFESYFLTFASGARLELMQTPDIVDPPYEKRAHLAGYAHIAISVGSTQEVDNLSARLQKDGFQIVDGPRRTGDGYYESSVLDPDGNRIEITI